jgi:hypothetical protein
VNALAVTLAAMALAPPNTNAPIRIPMTRLVGENFFMIILYKRKEVPMSPNTNEDYYTTYSDALKDISCVLRKLNATIPDAEDLFAYVLKCMRKRMVWTLEIED